jgi:hypothetical protein
MATPETTPQTEAERLPFLVSERFEAMEHSLPDDCKKRVRIGAF